MAINIVAIDIAISTKLDPGYEGTLFRLRPSLLKPRLSELLK
jgi:hypothetical protein